MNNLIINSSVLRIDKIAQVPGAKYPVSIGAKLYVNSTTGEQQIRKRKNKNWVLVGVVIDSRENYEDIKVSTAY